MFIKGKGKSPYETKKIDDNVQVEKGVRSTIKDIFGYIALYGTSVFPVVIAAGAVYLFFVTSLKWDGMDIILDVRVDFF